MTKMATMLGRHNNVPTELRETFNWLRFTSGVTRIMLGRIERCGHRYTAGHIRFHREERTALIFKTYLRGAVMNLTVVTSERENLKQAVLKRFGA